MFKIRRLSSTFLPAMLLLSTSPALISQSTERRAAASIHDPIDENTLITLGGNTRSEAGALNDLGPVKDDLDMGHMMLQLKRSPKQEQAVAQFVDDLHDPKSPNFHKWLTAVEFGKNFGLADADIQAVTGWLKAHGFVVNSVYPQRHDDRFFG